MTLSTQVDGYGIEARLIDCTPGGIVRLRN